MNDTVAGSLMEENAKTRGLVSVIVPNYNHEKFIRQRLDTVLNQSHDNIEIIILDDHSSDNSLAIVDSYRAHPKVKAVIESNDNSGNPFAQWKRGIESASGEFIWIAESDDFNELDFLGTLIGHHRDHPSIGLAYSNSYITDASGAIIDRYRYRSEVFDDDRWETSFLATGADEVINYFVYKCTIPNVSGVLFKREAIVDNIEAIQHLKFSGDYLLYALIMRDYDIFYDARPLNYYREHEATTRVFAQRIVAPRMQEEIAVRSEIARQFQIDAGEIAAIRERNIDRRDRFVLNTDHRMKHLLAKLTAGSRKTNLVLAPYNEYTKIIVDVVTENGFSVSVILDRKKFKQATYFKGIPVRRFEPESIAGLNGPVMVIASDRYKDELQTQLAKINDVTVPVLIF